MQGYQHQLAPFAKLYLDGTIGAGAGGKIPDTMELTVVVPPNVASGYDYPFSGDLVQEFEMNPPTSIDATAPVTLKTDC
jgi:hypothetical protein